MARSAQKVWLANLHPMGWGAQGSVSLKNIFLGIQQNVQIYTEKSCLHSHSIALG